MIATVTIKFTENEVKILINSLESTIDAESVFTTIPKNMNTLLKELKAISKMINTKKHDARIDKKDYGPPYGPHNPTGNELYDDLDSLEVPNPKKEYIKKITGKDLTNEESRNGPELCDNCDD